MAEPPRYYNLFRHSPSGREEKRLLNRARKCRFCPQPLGADRALFELRKGFQEFDLAVAHPACADEELRQIGERSQAEQERIRTAGEAYAAEMRARSRLIVVDGPPSLRL